MTSRRISIVVVVALLTIAACSPSERPATAPSENQDDAAGGGTKTPEKKGEDATGDDKKDGEGETPEGTGSGAETDGSEGSDGSDDLTEGSGEDDHSSAAYPAAGTYSYRQKGFEEFCQGASCERERLPARQPVTIETENAGPDQATVEIEIKSGSRTVRSTTRFDRAHALITKVYVRFAYSGFNFEETYTPEPPVDSLRFPLTAGESWSGSWRDSTSGDYRVAVFDKETLQVGGRSVQAFHYQTFTDFRGQFSGRSKVDTWIDPATKAIVKTDGVLNVTSAFGRYSTSFKTELRSGPEYR